MAAGMIVWLGQGAIVIGVIGVIGVAVRSAGIAMLMKSGVE
jgi:hypothetical protein